MILEYKIEVINCGLLPRCNLNICFRDSAFYEAEENLLATMGRGSWVLADVVFVPESYQAKYYFYRERKNRAVPW